MERESNGERRESNGALQPRKGGAPPRFESSFKGFKCQAQGPVQEKQGQRKGLTSYYFAGIPESHADRDMWQIFQRWGRVWDVYMPGRVNRQGERFGFVRFMEVREPKSLEKELQTLTIGNVRVQVNLPKYDRVVKDAPKEMRNRASNGERYQQNFVKKGSDGENKVEKGKSYAEVLKQHRPAQRIWQERGRQNPRGGGEGKVSSRDDWSGPVFDFDKINQDWLSKSCVASLRDTSKIEFLHETFQLE